MTLSNSGSTVSIDEETLIFEKLNSPILASEIAFGAQRTIEDIIRWLKESPAPSVLVATNLFGPDVIIKCHGLLLMGLF